jgi:serine O-acetyltransferase
LFRRIREDIRNVFDKDPAARSVPEVLCCYPGLHAIWLHRISHWLWTHKLRFLGRLLSHLGRFLTNIEIHPGARIGRRVFIDHGSGVVIGETSELGDDCLLYQGVVLGGTTLEKKKRHATLGHGVVMGTGSITLGPITIGDGARVGAGSVVVKSVPPGVTVVGIPGRIVTRKQKPVAELEHARLPDPVHEDIRNVLREEHRLEARVRELERLAGINPGESGGFKDEESRDAGQ